MGRYIYEGPDDVIVYKYDHSQLSELAIIVTEFSVGTIIDSAKEGDIIRLTKDDGPRLQQLLDGDELGEDRPSFELMVESILDFMARHEKDEYEFDSENY